MQRMLDLVSALRPETAAAKERAGDDVAPWNFSRDGLECIPQELLVVAADDFGWSDLGTRQRSHR